MSRNDGNENTNKDMKRLKMPAKVSRQQLLIFGLVFALIGVYFLWKSFAAAPLVAKVEAEQMVLPAGATAINDAAASAGQAVKMTQNGDLSGSLSAASTVNSLTLTTRSDKCQGWPSFSLSIDNQAVLTTNATGTGWRTYSATVNLSSGAHKVNLNFSGANTTSRCQRALYVDVINFYGPEPVVLTPTLSFSASPSTVTAGSSSTLTWNSTNTSSCSASGGWSGFLAVSGSSSTGALNQTKTYSLSCSGSAGTVSKSVTVTVTSVTPPPPPPEPPTTTSNFVVRNGTHLYLNGSLWRFHGMNNYGALGRCGPGDGIPSLPNGYTIRFWAFPSQVGSDYSRLDALIAEAKAHNDKLIPVFTNNWTDCSPTTDDTALRSFMANTAARYKNEPTIAFWQLVNEGTNFSSSWYSDHANLVRQNDPNHLVSYGAFNDLYHQQIIAGDSIVDPHDYGQGSTAMPSWLQTTINAAHNAGIPVIIGESGIYSSVGLSTRATWFQNKMTAAKNAGVDGYLVWGWQTSEGFGVFAGDPLLSVISGY